MKKSYISRTFLLFSLALAIFVTACNKDKESEGIAKVTTFAKIELVGGTTYSHTINTPYSEPGYSASDASGDLTSQVEVSGSEDVDSNTAGVYPVTYTVTNKDGFKTVVVRNVVVFDNSSVSNTDISGSYASVVLRSNLSAGTSATRPSTGSYTITLKKITTGLFSIDDFLGGWYWIGSAYGVDYAYSGLIVLKADNSIALVSADMDRGWGDGIILDPNSGEHSQYDPATNKLYLFSYMGSVNYLKFAVTLTKKEE
jgi:hypothetical protein